MVLQAGLTDVQKLMSGDVAGKKFTKIVVGTSDTPVTMADTSITGALAKDILTVDYFPGFVQFNTTIESGDPAMTIKEIGLLSDTGALMFRKVIPAVDKIAGTTYALSYKIKVQ
jgi:hypothetical protein